jgi:hypothetical protein
MEGAGGSCEDWTSSSSLACRTRETWVVAVAETAKEKVKQALRDKEPFTSQGSVSQAKGQPGWQANASDPTDIIRPPAPANLLPSLQSFPLMPGTPVVDPISQIQPGSSLGRAPTMPLVQQLQFPLHQQRLEQQRLELMRLQQQPQHPLLMLQTQSHPLFGLSSLPTNPYLLSQPTNGVMRLLASNGISSTAPNAEMTALQAVQRAQTENLVQQAVMNTMHLYQPPNRYLQQPLLMHALPKYGRSFALSRLAATGKWSEWHGCRPANG